MENRLKNQLQESLLFIRSKIQVTAEIAIILGSGLGHFSKTIKSPCILPTKNIPHYPLSTVPGHDGNWFWGKVADVPIIVLQGRVHFYEGYTLQQVTYPIHLLAGLGVKTVIITTASGGLNPDFSAGDLMVIADQINFAFNNPLIGSPINQLGRRFPDMSACYDRDLITLAEESGKKLGIPLRKGVFCWVTGPAYETAAEVRMLRSLGGDAVSMSTAPEVIIANQRHLRVLGISLITNLGTGLSNSKLSHSEVTETAARAENEFIRLLVHIIQRIAKFNDQ